MHKSKIIKMYIVRKYSTVILFPILLFIILTMSCKSEKEDSHVKNVILMIGDGMGVSQVYAGLTSNHGALNIAGMKYIGFQKTYSSDNYTTDSAASGTAIATGVKTKNGMIGMSPDSLNVRSILEIADEYGLGTGLISTSAITHATPASFIAHQVNRTMYEAIALDFLASDIDLFIGGGMKHFTNREDGRNLLSDFYHKGYTVYSCLDSVGSCVSDKLIVLTADVHNPPVSEGRGDMLPDATEKAIQVLDKNPEGFFLMVEGSQIDWGGHKNDIDYIVQETVDFDRAVKRALDFAEDDGETLVIVTADHECGGLALNNGDISSGRIDASFSTKGHTGVMVPVFAAGPGADEFIGIYENTDLFNKILNIYGLDQDNE